MSVTFQFDPERCSACGACSIACMDQNDIDVSAGHAPYRRVLSLEEHDPFQSLSLACRHCIDSPCIHACPVNCLYKDPHSTLTLYDNSACIGCRACAAACPYDAITFRKTEKHSKMEKCHGCITRILEGLQPACVRVCPTGALTVHIEAE